MDSFQRTLSVSSALPSMSNTSTTTTSSFFTMTPLNAQVPRRDSAVTQRLPGFGYVYRKSPRHTPSEYAVLHEGHPWVQTNELAPHWTINMADHALPEHIGGGPPDRLNRHGHHGPNTHRIVRGQLTITRRVPGEPHQELTISNNGVDPVSAPVPGDVSYDGVTTRDVGCTFVEGHYCLSPTTALRFMRGGTLRWFGPDGRPVPERDQQYVMNELDRAITRRGDDETTLEGFKLYGRRPLAAAMRTWVAEEWHDLIEEQQGAKEFKPPHENDEGDSLMT